jgi:phosphatidylserine/phosphatidylglycerophosphate/cardiolipin synthase-like enzyme
MALFEINKKLTTNDIGTANNKNTNDFVICKSPDKLKKLIDSIGNNNVWYVSNGDWSMHDLLMELLILVNPVELYITTYALREFAVRQMVLAIEKGLIKNVHMLLDYRAQRRTPDVYQFAQNNFTNIKLTSVHAKVCVLKAVDKCITITGSANWTQNPRIESGVITDDYNVGMFNINWIKNIMKDAEIFK